MATLESTPFVQFAFPLSNPPFHNRNTLWSSESSGSIPLLNASGSQRIQRPTATFSRSGYQIEAERNTAARAKDDESDDDLPFLEEQSRATLRPKISTAASNAGSTFQCLEQPALHRAGLQVNRTQPGERQGGSRDQPVTLDNDDLDNAGAGDKAEGAFGDVDTGCIEQDASLYNTFATSEPAFEPHSVPSASGQAQTQTFPQSSRPLQDQTNQQGVDDITQSTSVGFALHSLPKLLDSGDDGWTDKNMAELEKELGLALGEQQVESSSAGTPTSPSPRTAEAPQDEIQSRESTENTSSRPEELQDTSRHGTARGLEWEQRETQVGLESEAVAAQQQEELVAQEQELGQPTAGDQQDFVEVVDLDDPEDKEGTEDLLSTQPEIDEKDEYRFRLRGVRARQLPRRQTKTTQYRVVWGEYPNRSDFWFNEDDVRMSILLPPCKPSQDLVPLAQRDVMRVHRMRYDRGSEGKKIFEYLVDKSRTWISESQLRISLSPMLVNKLKAFSPYPLNQAQRDVLLKHSAIPIRDEHCHASRASRSPSPSLSSPAPRGEPESGKPGEKRRHQDTNKKISGEIPYSEDSDRSHKINNDDDDGDGDPRPAKRRRLPSQPTHKTPRSLFAHNSKTRLRQRHNVTLPLATQLEVDDIQPQADPRNPPAPVDNEQHSTPRPSRSPSAPTESAPIAEYQEWPFQGFLKRTKIGDETAYNLEFKLPCISGQRNLPINLGALDMCSSKEAPARASTPHSAVAHSEVPPATLRPKRKCVLWKAEENETILKMKEEGCSWEEIHHALPDRTPAAIQVRYSTKLKEKLRWK